LGLHLKFAYHCLLLRHSLLFMTIRCMANENNKQQTTISVILRVKQAAGL